MLNAKVLNHPYFKADVEINITPKKANKETDCVVKSTNISYLEGRSYIWWITIPGVYQNALEALEELTKPIYDNDGISDDIKQQEESLV